MANFLDMRCPSCGDEDRIDVQATVWLRMTANGTDADESDNGDHEYDPTSTVKCCACHYFGKLADFEPEAQP